VFDLTLLKQVVRQAWTAESEERVQARLRRNLRRAAAPETAATERVGGAVDA
jgi:hypothetical protein